MALNIYDNLFGIKHHLLGWHRRLFSCPVDRFIRAMLDQGLDVKDDGNSCPMCGYARALINLPNGWSLNGCSATEFRKLVRRKELTQLFSDDCERGSAITSSSANLPRSTF